VKRKFDPAATPAADGTCVGSTGSQAAGQALTILRSSIRLCLAICTGSIIGTDTLLAWMDRSRQRSALDRLSDQMLKDIGISRADVDFEARKPFWRE
jgi:uncharacterized protein YjiS (DUF1127 family)